PVRRSCGSRLTRWDADPSTALRTTSDPLDVGPVAGVDADLVPGADEEGNVDGEAGFERRRLITTGGGVAFEPGLGLGHLEHHIHRHVDADRLILIHQNLELGTV